jgi:hypothetical protein
MAAAPADELPGRTGEQDGNSRQVRQDLVLTDIGVLGPGGIGGQQRWCSRGGTGRRPCRRTTLIPAAARTARM